MRDHAERINAAFAEVMDSMHDAMADGYQPYVDAEEIRLVKHGLAVMGLPMTSEVSFTLNLGTSEIASVTFRSKRELKT